MLISLFNGLVPWSSWWLGPWFGQAHLLVQQFSPVKLLMVRSMVWSCSSPGSMVWSRSLIGSMVWSRDDSMVWSSLSPDSKIRSHSLFNGWVPLLVSMVWSRSWFNGLVPLLIQCFGPALDSMLWSRSWFPWANKNILTALDRRETMGESSPVVMVKPPYSTTRVKLFTL